MVVDGTFVRILVFDVVAEVLMLRLAVDDWEKSQ
jgi:hypothetical protein